MVYGYGGYLPDRAGKRGELNEAGEAKGKYIPCPLPDIPSGKRPPGYGKNRRPQAVLRKDVL